MSRKEEQWRNEGMALCINYLEKNNNDIEGLKAEVKRRGAYHIPLAIKPGELAEFEDRVRFQTVDTVMIMSMAVLHDNFDFGKVRMQRFRDYFQYACDMMMEDRITWEEIQTQFADQYGWHLPIRYNKGRQA